MSASAVVPAVATTGGDVDNGVDLKEEVSDRIEAFARLLDPFAEGSKFTAINDAAVTIGDSNATESDVVAGADDNTGGGKEGGVAAIKIETKVTAKDTKNAVTKTTPKKRGVAAKNGEDAPAKKKRATAKAKKASTDNEDNVDAADPDLPITPPVTPKKKGRGRKASSGDDANVSGSAPKAKGGKKVKASESAEESAEPSTSQESPSTTKTGTPRKRAAVTKDKAVARGLPTSMKECSEADRMLLHMKDVEGKPWADIRAAWKTMTNQETASSTLPNRYNRLKANLMELKEGDAPRLLAAKSEIEAEFTEYVVKFNAEKWLKIQKAMDAKGCTNKYPSIFLQKKYDELAASGAAAEGKDAEVGGDGSAGDGAAEEEGVKEGGDKDDDGAAGEEEGAGAEEEEVKAEAEDAS